MHSSDKDRLGSAPIIRLIFSLSVPAIIAQIINALYSIVDRIYISRIPHSGALALTGVGICFPIFILSAAFAVLIGVGGSTRAAIELGKKNQEKAEKILGNSFTLLVLSSVLIMVLFYSGMKPILFLFGASRNTYPFARDYLTIYLSGTLFSELAVGLNPFIACQGKSKTAMTSILIGAVLNIILDPVFIFGLHMGVKGGAVATVISQAFSMLYVTGFLSSQKRTELLLSKKNFMLKKGIVLSILSLGVSSFIMQVTECLISVVFNAGLKKYGGDAYVGAMTIIQTVVQLIFILSNGLAQGVQPVISYNFGAAKVDRVKSACRFAFISQITAESVLALLVMIFPGQFALPFTTDKTLIAIVTRMMPVFVSGLGIFGIQQAAQCAFVGLGQTKIPIFLACFRKVILLVPLALILPHFFGPFGIFVAEPVSDITSACVSGYLFKKHIDDILHQGA